MNNALNVVIHNFTKSQSQDAMSGIVQVVDWYFGNQDRMIMVKHDICMNEDRITKLEVYAKQRKERVDSIEEHLKDLDENIKQLCVSLAQINSILTTLKWVIGIFVILFSGIICFLVKGLIHII